MSEKLEAVRKAIAAYAAALEAIKKAAPHVPGTCVMSRNQHSGYYTCSECEGKGSAGDKFCARCGSEVIRFDDLNQPREIILDVREVKSEPRTVTLPKLNPTYTTKKIRIPTGMTRETHDRADRETHQKAVRVTAERAHRIFKS
jgi:hypothetical protein